MRVINVSLNELETKVLMIGFQGENEITQVRIDAAEILTDYPNATPTLIVKPLFGFAYPVIVAKEDTDVVWEIDNSVLSFHGDGEIQLTFTAGSVIAKSYVGRIRIKRSLAVTGEAPDPIETWEQAATAKLAEVDAQIGELEDMVEAAEAAKDQAQDIVDDAAADIQAAGATQIAAVEAKGEEVKDSIPSDYTALTGEVSGLKSAFGNTTGNTIIDMTNGYYYPLSGSTVDINNPTANANYQCALVPCESGDRFTVSGHGGTNAKPWGFIDSNGNVLLTSDNTYDVHLVDVELTAPSNSAYLIINNNIIYGTGLVSFYGIFVKNRLSVIDTEIENQYVYLSDANLWTSGNFSDGYNELNENRMTYIDFVKYSTGYRKISVFGIYRIIAIAFDDASGDYIGVLRTNNEYATTGTTAKLLSFDVSTAPKNYKYRIVVLNNSNESQGIPSSALANFVIKKSAPVDNVKPYVIVNDSNYWRIAGFSDGSIVTATNRAILKKRVKEDDKYTVVTVPTGYKLTVGAWNENGDYIGVWRSTNSFSTSGTTKWIKTFDMSKYSNYTLMILVAKLDNSDIEISETNSFSIIRHHYVDYDTCHMLLDESLQGVDTYQNIKSVSRLGYGSNIPNLPPENSILGYKMAYKAGFRTMLCDVAFTSDHVPVCLHDESINRVARNTDGSEIATTKNIVDMTLQEVDEYDFGLWKGQQYAGLKILRLSEFLKYCKLLNWEPWIEIKNWSGNQLSTDNFNALCNVIDSYGIGNKCSFNISQYPDLQTIHEKYPLAGLSQSVDGQLEDYTTWVSRLLAVKDNNKVNFVVWMHDQATGQVGNAIVEACVENDIGLYLSEIKTEEQFNQFITDANQMCADTVAIRFKTFDNYAREKFL